MKIANLKEARELAHRLETLQRILTSGDPPKIVVHFPIQDTMLQTVAGRKTEEAHFKPLAILFENFISEEIAQVQRRLEEMGVEL